MENKEFTEKDLLFAISFYFQEMITELKRDGRKYTVKQIAEYTIKKTREFSNGK